MNVKHLQYMIEIERVGSISQAAKNLYVGQPNLSRILKEVEDGYAVYNFNKVYHAVHNFCVIDMSNFYLRQNASGHPSDRAWHDLPAACPQYPPGNGRD